MEKQIEKTSNPYNICSWKSKSECNDCSDSDDLNCRFNFKKLFQFYFIFLLYGIPAFIGVKQSGYGNYLWGWAIMAIIFFGFWEIYILCCHCPYYAKKGFVLRCIANYGCPKFWEYHPEPISKSKKFQLILGLALMSGYPFIFMVLGEQLLYLILSLCGLVLFFGALIKFICTKCVNFSCIFNRVPKKKVDRFLKRNPVMRKAWEEAGWQIEENNISYRDRDAHH